MSETAKQTAALIWSCWQRGETIRDLPPQIKPVDRAAGYAAQARLEDLAAGPREGWKIAATSAAGQAHINVDGPMVGRLLPGTLLTDGAEVSLRTNRMRVVEPEFAFRLGRDLPAQAEGYAPDAVMAAVTDLCLALELPDSRFEDFASVGGPSLIADNACARALVVGPAVRSDWRALDLSAHPVHCTVGTRYTRAGIGANVLGDPRTALTWCVNELSALGIGITAGELVTTGTSAIPLEVLPGDRVTCDYGVLGTISVVLTD